jgi:hypothetical protein
MASLGRTLVCALIIFAISGTFDAKAQSPSAQSPGFKAFTESTAKKNATHTMPVLIPEGRSPERFQTSNAAPRILVGFSKSQSPSQLDSQSSYYAKRVYFAFAKKAKLAQKIEFNPETHQFDFYVDKNYDGSKAPNFTLVQNRAECLSCHQSGGPIFAGPGQWNEMNEIVGGMGDGNVTARIRAAVGKPIYEGYKITGIAGLPFVNNVLSSEQLLLASEACAKVGKESPEVRAWLLEKAILKMNFSEKLDVNAAGLLMTPKKKAQTKELTAAEKTILDNWPKGNSSLRSSMLPDIPQGMSYESLKNRYAKGQRTLAQVSFGAGLASRKNQDLEALIDELNPALPREFVSYPPKDEALEYLEDTAFECLGFTEEDQKDLNARSEDELKKALASPLVSEALGFWPASRSKLMNAIDGALKQTSYCADCAKAKATESQKLPLADSLAHVQTTKEKSQSSNQLAEALRPISTQHLKLLCSECHVASTGIRPTMPFEDESQMQAFVKSNSDALVSVVEQGYMPPSFAAAHPSTQLRKEIVDWIKGLED